MKVNTILILDDDREDVHFFRSALHQINPDIRLIHLEATEELMHHLQSSLPDLLLIDSFINVERGVSVVRSLRNIKLIDAIPVMMYSGSAHPKVYSEAFDAGAIAYLVKPSSVKEIKTMLEELLNCLERGKIPTRQYYLDGWFENHKVSIVPTGKNCNYEHQRTGQN